MMMTRIDDETRITQEAARWFGSLIDSNARRADFFRWLEESPRHVEEFLFILADAQDLALLTGKQRQRIDELSREIGSDASASPNVVPLCRDAPVHFASATTRDVETTSGAPPPHWQPGARRLIRRWTAALAALLLLTVGVSWWLTGPGSWRTYSTEIGEQRALELADGSVVDLNTNSSVTVRLTDTSRTVRLLRGEALFSVKHDPRRPFLVHTSSAVIQAIGTRFNVYRRDGRTQVAVIEGLVQVSDATDLTSAVRASTTPTRQFLNAGEGADVSDSGNVSEPKSVDAARAVAWRQRRLVFEEDTLGEIAAEFNRYNAAVKIRVDEEVAGEEHFSGTFDADAPEAMMQALAGDLALEVTRAGNEIVIRRREP